MTYTGFRSVSTLNLLITGVPGSIVGPGDTIKNQTQGPRHQEAFIIVYVTGKSRVCGGSIRKGLSQETSAET